MSVISDMITALETSNKLLKTYHDEQNSIGLKKDLIAKMINVNTQAMIAAMELQSEVRSDEINTDEMEAIGQFVLIPVENFDAVINGINGIKEVSVKYGMIEIMEITDDLLDNLSVE